MMPLRTLLKPLSGLLLASLACAALAAPQHALTLYDEPPKYPANFKHVDYVNPDAPKGGTFRKSSLGSFDSLNPFINKGVPADDISLTFDTLARQTLDEPFTAYGLIAEKIEKAPDNSWVRFYLRPEAKFNDGHPIRAEDVVFSFDTLMKNGSPLFKGYYSDVDQAIAETPLQVKFTFKHTKNRELPLILGQLPVLPKHWWETRDFAKGSLEVPVGSGPYTITEIKPGRFIRYERNKDYWGKDLPINKGLYNFDTITVDYFRDNSVAFEALKAGQFDYWLEISAKNWASAYNAPAFTQGRLKKKKSAITTRPACRVLCSTCASRCSRMCGCVKRLACCSTLSGPISNCSAALTHAPAVILKIRKWLPRHRPAKQSWRFWNLCAGRSLTKCSLRLSNPMSPTPAA